jgi:hypothetical protein
MQINVILVKSLPSLIVSERSCKGLNIQLMLNDPWIYNQPLTCTKAITMLYSSVSTSQGMPMLCSNDKIWEKVN